MLNKLILVLLALVNLTYGQNYSEYAIVNVEIHTGCQGNNLYFAMVSNLNDIPRDTNHIMRIRSVLNGNQTLDGTGLPFWFFMSELDATLGVDTIRVEEKQEDGSYVTVWDIPLIAPELCVVLEVNEPIKEEPKPNNPDKSMVYRFTGLRPEKMYMSFTEYLEKGLKGHIFVIYSNGHTKQIIVR